MPKWTLDKHGVTPSVTLKDSEQDKLNTFMGNIQRDGQHPKDAASVGGYDYKLLDKNTQLYQIRLSQKNRATFYVDENTHTVVMCQVGGHT